MTVSIEWRDEYETYDYGRVSGNERPSRVLSRAALACVALACAFIAWTHLSGGGADKAADQAFDEGTQSAPPSSNYGRSSIASNAYAKLAAALKSHMRRSAASTSEAALFDSRFSLGFPPGTFSIAAAVKGDREPAVTGALSDPAIATTQAAVAAPRLAARARHGEGCIRGATASIAVNSRRVAARRGRRGPRCRRRAGAHADDLRETFRQAFAADAGLRRAR